MYNLDYFFSHILCGCCLLTVDPPGACLLGRSPQAQPQILGASGDLGLHKQAVQPMLEPSIAFKHGLIPET